MSKKRYLILLFLSLGIAYALLTIFGLIKGYEHKIALSIILSAGVICVLIYPDKPKRRAFLSGAVMAISALLTQAAFYSTYAKNNPEYIDVELSMNLGPVAYTLLFSPLGAVLAGSLTVIFTAITQLAFKLLRSAP